jgi:hypothetical protein
MSRAHAGDIAPGSPSRGRATYVREVWQMSDGRIDYFAPLPPSRLHQSAGRDGRCIYRLRIFVRSNFTASRGSIPRAGGCSVAVDPPSLTARASALAFLGA